jgi:peptidoglycan/xylan/chitin deacetylase (PgdA/CDA1 family)
VTPQLLDVLRSHEVKATFFLLGSAASQHPELVARIDGEGHEIGNHMWRDERAIALSDRDFERSLVATARVLSPRCALLLRPGSGLISRRKVRIAARHGYRCVLGSAYVFDAHVRSRRWLSRLLRPLIRRGVIVVLHEGRPSRRRVLGVVDDLLREADARGLTAAPVGRLLESAAVSRPARRW